MASVLQKLHAKFHKVLELNNTISLRVFDFLKNFPPFHILKESELLALSLTAEVLYFDEGETIFYQGEASKNQFFVVKEGAIGLYATSTENKLLINICDEGELFGLRAIIEKDAYKLHAIANEESIVYGIPVIEILQFMDSNDALAQFITTSFQVNFPENSQASFPQKIADFSEGYFDHQLVNFSKNPISCKSNCSIQQAALIMEKHRVGSIIIEENQQPLGIITDKDLRLKVATGKVAIDKKVTEIMSAPVVTASEEITIAEAQIQMLQHKITHLCITEKGTSNSSLKGILSEHDIVALRSNNPYTLLKEIKRASSLDQLKSIRQNLSKLIEKYIQQNASMDFVTQISGAINDALTQRIIDISLSEMPSEPPVPFTWLALGSQGRNEQLLLTDQDNALVFEDVSEANYEVTQQYFLKLAEKVNEGLYTLGYEFCPADMMARNPKWCLSLSQWKKQFQQWITQPDEDSIMLCTIFFDFKKVYGAASLSEQLAQHIFSSIGSFEIFLNYLARNAIQNPAPVGFFRQFVVEKDAQHKNEFDLKARALMPLIDAARVLILSHNLSGKNSTVARYRELQEKEPQNAAIFESCEEAFKLLLRFRTEQGITDESSGRYLPLEDLNKMEKLQLRACFKPLKDIQELLKIRFQLSQIM